MIKRNKNNRKWISCFLACLIFWTTFPLSFSSNASGNTFYDVVESSWYYPYVQFVQNYGLMKGTSDTTFEPDVSLTRAMLVTILYRLDGSDYQADKSEFKDVAAGTWYGNAVSWAADCEIVSGYGNGLFGPSDDITREQLSAIMYRYAVSKDYSDKQSADLTPFKDASLIHSWARESIEWAVAVKMISGKGSGVLDPLGNATRAEVAAIIQRFYEQFVKKHNQTEQIEQEDPAPEEYIKKTAQMQIDNPTVTGTAAASSNSFFSQRLILKTNGSIINFSDYNVSDYVVGPDNTFFLQFDSVSKAEKAEAKLKVLNSVIYVEPDQYVASIDDSRDTSSLETNRSWGVSVTGAGQYAEYLANLSSNRVKVAVIDTGVANHPHLRDRISGVGYDLVDNDFDPNDENFHGTHVTGTIVDCTEGLNNVVIIPIRVLDENGNGSESNVGNGIRYAVNHGAKVINLSLCSPIKGKRLRFLEESIQYAVSRGVCVVQASGNSNGNTEYYSPVNMNEEIVVGAVDMNYRKASFSNYGDSLDIVAPGVEIVSCFPGGNYESLDGTSMAAPHVTAAAAMLLVANPSMTPNQVEEILKENTTDLGDPGWDIYFGSGLLNLKKLGRSIIDVAFNANGGNVSTGNLQVRFDDVYGMLPTPTRSGYDFDGWYTAASGGTQINSSTMVNTTDDHTLYAHWNALYTVTFDANGGNIESKNRNVTFGKIYGYLPVPFRPGYEFAGWYTEPVGGKKIRNSTIVDINKNHTLYAHWESYSAEEGNADENINWEVVKIGSFSSGKNVYRLRITGNGDIKDNNYNGDSNSIPWDKYKNSISEIIIYPGITRIGKRAFSGCSNVEEISIADTVTSVGAGAFYNCKTLDSLFLPDTVSSIGEYAFDSCTKMRSFEFPQNITAITYGMFSECSNLTNVSIPDAVQSIDINAFWSCNSLKDVRIPLSTDSIGKDAFAHCYSLKSIDVDPDNTEFRSEKGVLFYHDTTLLIYPPGRDPETYKIPDGTVIIGENAFNHADKLKTLIMPDSIRTIDKNAFYCNNLSDIYFTKGVRRIGSNAFRDCKNLSHVYYSGSEIEWSGWSYDWQRVSVYYNCIW